jgi:hypothetical protein
MGWLVLKRPVTLRPFQPAEMMPESVKARRFAAGRIAARNCLGAMMNPSGAGRDYSAITDGDRRRSAWGGAQNPVRSSRWPWYSMGDMAVASVGHLLIGLLRKLNRRNGGEEGTDNHVIWQANCLL